MRQEGELHSTFTYGKESQSECAIGLIGLSVTFKVSELKLRTKSEGQLLFQIFLVGSRELVKLCLCQM